MGRPLNKRYFGPNEDGEFRVVGLGNFTGAPEECHIVRQRSVTRFEVANEDDERMTAMLTEGTPAEGEFQVLVQKHDGGDVEHARKITNRRVYTKEGGSYDLVIGAAADDNPRTANVSGLGGKGYSDVAPSGATTTITADPTSVDAGAASTITVQAKDSAGNNLTTGGATVVLSTSHGEMVDEVDDKGDGTYTQEVTNATAEEGVTISGTINGEAITDTAVVDFT